MASNVDETSAAPVDPDKRTELTELIAKATAEYAVKHYSEAAELYSQATELQSELNGEMAIENADLYFSYGKCLYYLAQQSSDVLGGTATSASLPSRKGQNNSKKRKANGAAKHENSSRNNGDTGEGSGLIAKTLNDTMAGLDDVIPKETAQHPEEGVSDKPLFQISGDAEDWDDDSEDEDADQDEAGGDEGDDDFATAFELLDLARVLYLRQMEQDLEHAPQASDKGKDVASEESVPEVKSLKARIADIYDLQAEVALEGEKYLDAAADLAACLALREELEAPESSVLAECHYKLSLAHEFSGNTQILDEQGNPTGEVKVDWKLRNEAIAQQEKAIHVCKLRITKETAAMEKLEAGPAKEKAEAQIDDVQDMVSEMEMRLAELRQPPVSVKAESENEMKAQIQGVLGSLLGSGASEADKKEKLAQVTESATDISGMVKRKKPKSAHANGGDSGLGSAASTPAAMSTVGEGSNLGKRKVGFVDEVEDSDSGKKAKVEDAEDSGL